MARALGDAAGAREDVRRALAHEGTRPIPRYSWQLVWLGLRVEAEASEPAPEQVAALTALAGEPAGDDPAGARLPRARGRRGRAPGATRTGTAAVEACR